MRRKPFEHSGLQGNGFLIWGISKLNKIIGGSRRGIVFRGDSRRLFLFAFVGDSEWIADRFRKQIKRQKADECRLAAFGTARQGGADCQSHTCFAKRAGDMPSFCLNSLLK